MIWKSSSLHCVSEVMQWRENNSSNDRNSETNFTVVKPFQGIQFDELAKVANESHIGDLNAPYYVVPEISSFERGECVAEVNFLVHKKQHTQQQQRVKNALTKSITA